MKRATIYQRGKDLFIHASSETTAGVWILTAPCIRLEASAPDAEIGNGVLSALQGSQSGVRHPSVWTGLIDPLLKVANVKSWGTFAKNARAADAIEESGRFTLTPTKNLGPKDGFVDDPRSAMVLDSPNPEALGVALKRVLGASS